MVGVLVLLNEALHHTVKPTAAHILRIVVRLKGVCMESCHSAIFLYLCAGLYHHALFQQCKCGHSLLAVKGGMEASRDFVIYHVDAVVSHRANILSMLVFGCSEMVISVFTW